LWRVYSFSNTLSHSNFEPSTYLSNWYILSHVGV
jgi:hypothetical protein